MWAPWPCQDRISRSQDRSPAASSQSWRLIAALTKIRSTCGKPAARRISVTCSARQRSGSTARPSGAHQGRGFQIFARPDRQRRMRRVEIEPDIGVDAHPMAEMPAPQRSAPRVGDVVHVEVGQLRRLRLGAKAQQGRDGVRMAPETAPRDAGGLQAGCRVGKADGARDAAGVLGANDSRWATRGRGDWRVGCRGG